MVLQIDADGIQQIGTTHDEARTAVVAQGGLGRNVKEKQADCHAQEDAWRKECINDVIQLFHVAKIAKTIIMDKIKAENYQNGVTLLSKTVTLLSFWLHFLKM